LATKIDHGINTNFLILVDASAEAGLIRSFFGIEDKRANLDIGIEVLDRKGQTTHNPDIVARA